MAKTLSKTGIADNSQLFAAHVTQSIDALNGLQAYNLNPSGSVAITGSLIVSGSFIFSGLTSSISFSQAWISSSNFASDANAETGGIPVGGLYHNAGQLRVRLFVAP